MDLEQLELDRQRAEDKQPTGEIPVLKPVNLNTMIVAQVEDLKGQIWALADVQGIKIDIQHLKTLFVMGLVILCLILAGEVWIITAMSILFGRSGA